MTQIVNLRTEYQVKPLAVETRTPRFSWQYGKDFAGIQTAYRILVATSETLIEEEKADMWDSGFVLSDRSVGVEYAGKPLLSHSRYYIRCIAKVGGEEVCFSEISFFETALYGAEDWKGKWVSVPVNFNGGTLLFRKTIQLDENKQIVRARAYICGLGYHEFFVNGKKIGNSVLNPGVPNTANGYCIAFTIWKDLRAEKT